LDEPRIRGVVDGHPAVEPARELPRDEGGELSLARSPRKPARYEDGLIAARDPQALELVDRGRDRRLAWVPERARDRQRRRLDDDRGAPRAGDELREGRAGKGEAKRVANARGNVSHRL